MIRVIIADDEIRVCKLIIKLIDWDKLGMLIVGTASNGIEALELIEKENPDIVITDIRMPGYDGLEMIEKAKMLNNDLEFIIISGYGQFEYAKKGIDFGVKDYLLKPINKDDLLKALIKVGEHVQKKKGQINLEKEYELIIKNGADKIREAFLNNLIFFNTESFKEYTLSEVNENYHFNFQEGIFSIVALKIDYLDKGSESRTISMINIVSYFLLIKMRKLSNKFSIPHFSKKSLYIIYTTIFLLLITLLYLLILISLKSLNITYMGSDKNDIISQLINATMMIYLSINRISKTYAEIFQEKDAIFIKQLNKYTDKIILSKYLSVVFLTNIYLPSIVYTSIIFVRLIPEFRTCKSKKPLQTLEFIRLSGFCFVLFFQIDCQI